MANKKLAYERIIAAILSSKTADHIEGCRILIKCYAKQFAFTTVDPMDIEQLFSHLNLRAKYIEETPVPSITAMALLDNQEDFTSPNFTELDPNPLNS